MNGICVYCETYKGKPDQTVSELLTAARQIQEVTKEPICAIVAAEHCKELMSQLKELCFDEIYVVETGRDCEFQDDAVSTILSQMVEKINPSTVLIPATPVSRSLFSRVAANLGCGLTADCTDIEVVKRDNGTYFVKQNKPSYGENVMVSIVTKEGIGPQMLTIRQGVFSPCEEKGGNASVTVMEDIKVPASGIRVIEEAPIEASADSILAAEVVVVGGRGALEDDNYQLLEQFAKKVGGVIGGTRPLADTEIIPFENQIGQTGVTIRPKICISLGVSGAIQHTEGIKDTKLFIAVNTDEQAPIYAISDYGVAADMKDVLKALLEQ